MRGRQSRSTNSRRRRLERELDRLSIRKDVLNKKISRVAKHFLAGSKHIPLNTNEYDLLVSKRDACQKIIIGLTMNIANMLPYKGV